LKKGETIYEAYELTDNVDLQFERKVKDALKSIEQTDMLSNRIRLFYFKLYDDLKNFVEFQEK
jgi:hypothetical protein